MRFAGVAWRAIAFLIDAVVIGVYEWAILFSPVADFLGGPVLALLMFVVPIVYFVLAWGAFGTTIGMRVLGLRIIDAKDGTPIGWNVASFRALVLVAEIGLCAAGVGIVLIALPAILDKRRRSIHDRLSGTLVLRPAVRGS
jgi:uncharacterized RDD family membrane protein YckC